ncbi:hypothetical protein MINS_00150 [Mycolicibacterium insubricum]|nr:hypothetical protein MINS_00150 [Mycolicibacterium insubricum]
MRVSPAARAELRCLAAEFGTGAAVSAVIDDRITVLDLVGPPGVDVGVSVGQSYPFAPPVGLMFVLWDPAALRAWLAKAPTVPLRTDSARLDLVVDSCRSVLPGGTADPGGPATLFPDGRGVRHAARRVGGPAG